MLGPLDRSEKVESVGGMSARGKEGECLALKDGADCVPNEVMERGGMGGAVLVNVAERKAENPKPVAQELRANVVVDLLGAS